MNDKTIPGDPATIIPTEGKTADVLAAYHAAHKARTAACGYITGRKDGIRRRVEHKPYYSQRGDKLQYSPRTVKNTSKGTFYLMRMEASPGVWEERLIAKTRLPKHMA